MAFSLTSTRMFAVLFIAVVIGGPPARPEDVHLGVTSCAGSTCHGSASTTKKKSDVVQNEYLIWQRSDKHAQAYTVLQGALGRRIAGDLGIGPAERAQECLVCHADNVPAALRGVQFHIEDGVGCEACHGAAQKWLGPHVSGRVPHAELVADDGLYPTDQPQARASLCLGCHLGDASHVISHRIMGAGHPRLVFELQTFTQIQPAHFVIDDIYRRRKAVAAGVQVWAVGQAAALRQLAESLAAHQQHEGAFPELVFFDCAGCHHSTTSLRWQRRASMGLGPGLPHFNDANAIMLRVIAAGIAPDLGGQLQGAVRALHQALSGGAGRPVEAARRVADVAARLQEVLGGHDFTAGEMRAMLAGLSGAARAGDASDYAAAEQATMGFAAIIYTLKMSAAVDAAQYGALRAGLDRCYAATERPDSYDPQGFAAAAQSVVAAIPAS